MTAFRVEAVVALAGYLGFLLAMRWSEIRRVHREARKLLDGYLPPGHKDRRT